MSRRSTVVRFILPRRTRIPLVTVVLNHEHRAVFVVDTGASASALSLPSAERYGIRTTSTRARTLGASGQVRARNATLRSLQIGDIRIGRLSIAAIDLAPVAKAMSRQIDGVLGSDVLRRFVVTLDYPGRRMTLHRPGRRAIAGTR